MRNKWYVYEKGWIDPICAFDSYDEAEAFVQTQMQEDRNEGWFSSQYEICEGSDVIFDELETNS